MQLKKDPLKKPKFSGQSIIKHSYTALIYILSFQNNVQLFLSHSTLYSGYQKGRHRIVLKSIGI